MSGDPEQEYFSDGISEDIITDLSQGLGAGGGRAQHRLPVQGQGASTCAQVARAAERQPRARRQRAQGGRPRAHHRPADRRRHRRPRLGRALRPRPRPTSSPCRTRSREAIVAALKLKLLPEEKKAIERRGTDNVEAYNLYLMARQYCVTGNDGDCAGGESDRAPVPAGHRDRSRLRPRLGADGPGAGTLRFLFGGAGDGGLAAAERALALDPDLAEAHAVKARISSEDGRQDEADAEIAIALRLDPESYEVNNSAAALRFRQRAAARTPSATTKRPRRSWRRDFGSPGMLITCYTALGDDEARARAAQIDPRAGREGAGAGPEQRRGHGLRRRRPGGAGRGASAPRNGSTAPC